MSGAGRLRADPVLGLVALASAASLTPSANATPTLTANTETTTMTDSFLTTTDGKTHEVDVLVGACGVNSALIVW